MRVQVYCIGFSLTCANSMPNLLVTINRESYGEAPLPHVDIQSLCTRSSYTVFSLLNCLPSTGQGSVPPHTRSLFYILCIPLIREFDRVREDITSAYIIAAQSLGCPEHSPSSPTLGNISPYTHFIELCNCNCDPPRASD